MNHSIFQLDFWQDWVPESGEGNRRECGAEDIFLLFNVVYVFPKKRSKIFEWKVLAEHLPNCRFDLFGEVFLEACWLVSMLFFLSENSGPLKALLRCMVGLFKIVFVFFP